MNILLGDVVSVRPARADQYDPRATADAVERAWAQLSTDSDWVRMGPNFAQRRSNPSDVVNLYNEAMKYLSTQAAVAKTEVVFDNNGERDRYLLTPNELTSVQNTGVLPDAANVTARFRNAASWSVEAPSASAGKGGGIAVIAALAAAYLYFK